MYQLYWAQETGALAPQILLEEVGAQYQRIVLDLDKGEELAPEFLAINPLGKVPALTLPDGTIVTESGAIMLQIADAYPEFELLPPSGSSARALAYRWLFFAVASIYEASLRYFHHDWFSEDSACTKLIQQRAVTDIDQHWDLFERELGDGPYLLGQQYSVVDPYLLMLAYWHQDPQALFRRCPKLGLLCESTRARPAVERIWTQHYPEA